MKSIEVFFENFRSWWMQTFGPSLRQIFEDHHGRLVYKWDHYIPIYERYLQKYRGRSFVMVEIGVFQGGSLEIWRKYFGEGAKIYGVDINGKCQQFADEQTEILINDQASREFWTTFKANVPRVDVVIDDGGHTMEQQIVTFEEMFPAIEANGVYICEDLHSSYWPEFFGGGRGRPGTMVEKMKEMIDEIHGWHDLPKGSRVSKWTKMIGELSFFDSVVVLKNG